MNLAVCGPFGIALVFLLWGIYRLAMGKAAWWIPALGIAVLIVNVYGVGAAIG